LSNEQQDYTHDGWVFGCREYVEIVSKQGGMRKA